MGYTQTGVGPSLPIPTLDLSLCCLLSRGLNVKVLPDIRCWERGCWNLLYSIFNDSEKHWDPKQCLLKSVLWPNTFGGKSQQHSGTCRLLIEGSSCPRPLPQSSWVSGMVFAASTQPIDPNTALHISINRKETDHSPDGQIRPERGEQTGNFGWNTFILSKHQLRKEPSSQNYPEVKNEPGRGR